MRSSGSSRAPRLTVEHWTGAMRTTGARWTHAAGRVVVRPGTASFVKPEIAVYLTACRLEPGVSFLDWLSDVAISAR